MTKSRQIVGKFNKTLDNIEFYEIIKSFNNYTIIKKINKVEYLLYNEEGYLSKNSYDNIDNMINDLDKMEWTEDVLFFWADSKFVTEVYKSNYDILVDLYKNMKVCKRRELELKKELSDLKTKSLIGYIYYSITLKILNRKQNKSIRKIVKEFKIIWPN